MPLWRLLSIFASFKNKPLLVGNFKLFKPKPTKKVIHTLSKSAAKRLVLSYPAPWAPKAQEKPLGFATLGKGTHQSESSGRFMILFHVLRRFQSWKSFWFLLKILESPRLVGKPFQTYWVVVNGKSSKPQKALKNSVPVQYMKTLKTKEPLKTHQNH